MRARFLDRSAIAHPHTLVSIAATAMGTEAIAQDAKARPSPTTDHGRGPGSAKTRCPLFGHSRAQVFAMKQHILGK
jgi:hypothetical protein